MSEFSQHMPPEQAEQLQALEQQLLDAAADVEQAVQNIDTKQRAATRPEGPPEGSSHDGVIKVGPENPIEYSGAKPVVTTRKPGGASRPQGPAVPAGVLGGRFTEIQQTEYKNGVKHVYGVDENGKKQHLSFEAILEAYGHAGDTQGKRADRVTEDQLDENELAEIQRRKDQNANQMKPEIENLAQYETYEADELARAAHEANSIGDEVLRDTLKQMAYDKLAKYVVDGRLTQDQYAELKNSLDAFMQSQNDEVAPKTATTSEENNGEAATADNESAIREQYRGYNEQGLVNAARAAHEDSDDHRRDVLEQMASEMLDGWVTEDKMTIEQSAQLRSDFAKYIRGAEVTRPDGEISEPITDPSEQGMKARVARIWGKAKDAAMSRSIRTQNAVGFAVNERLNTDQEESERSKRRGIYTGVAVGALILGSYVALKYGSDIVDGARDMFDGKKSPSPENIPDKKQAQPGNGNEFNFARKTMNVRPGEGFEDSLQQQYGLTDAQSHKLYGQLKPELQGSAGTYLQAGEVRISDAGAFEYSEAQRRIIEEFLKNKS